MGSVVLMYHDIVVSDDKTSGFQNASAFQYKLDEKAFEEHVEALTGKDVVFTFDDGGVSFLTKAAPILEKHGRKGIFFISTKYIGTSGFLDVKQIQELSRRGHAIGSHTHTHPGIFTKLSSDEIENEWSQSYTILREILGDVEFSASVPNGYASSMVLDMANRCGFKKIFTSQPTTEEMDGNGYTVIGRYVVLNGMTGDDVLRIVTNRGYRLKLSAKWHILNMLKRILGSSYDTVKAKIMCH